MAIDFSKLNFFSRLDARARVLVLLGAIIGVIVLIYFGTQYLSSGNTSAGASNVAGAPQGLQSVPGSQLTPEYYRALQQANQQSAQQAQITGGSAVPTLINVGGEGAPSGSCIVCSDESANVKNYLNDWVKQGKVTPDIAKQLTDLADQNVTDSEYAAMLDQLTKAGKLTPAQARQLLAEYKKQHASSLMKESTKAMDDMIKTGDVPLEVANELLAAQKKGISTTDYAALIQDRVKDGSITPAVAQQLLTQYTQQRAREIVKQSIASLHKMAAAGQITPDVEKDLVGLENKMVPVDMYAAALQRYVAAGKMTPAVADSILTEFKSQKSAIGPSGKLADLLKAAEAAAFGEISDLLAGGQITQATANQLRDMIQRNIPLADFIAAINTMVQQKQLTPELSKLKIADYKLVKGYRDASESLGKLQGNNASNGDYSTELKRLVQAGLLTPAEAAQLMQEYQANAVRQPIGAPTGPVTPGAEGFARLEQRLQGGAASSAPAAAPDASQFAAAQAQAEQETDNSEQQRIQNLVTAMSGQAGQLISSWQPPTMASRAAAASTTKTTTTTTTTDGAAGASGSAAAGAGADVGIPLIKAGTISYAVLDTAVSSDYPSSPVLATIVEGKYKGAKLLGTLVTTKGVSGQLDRVSLNFTLMNMDIWPKSKTVTAYAIDPDTDRSVFASSVNYHYMQRFGAIMATSFLQGYAKAITNQGTVQTSVFGTNTTTYPELDPSQKLAVALGQIGTNLGTVTQNYVNIPPTVKVDSGVGLGILFMADVT